MSGSRVQKISLLLAGFVAIALPLDALGSGLDAPDSCFRLDAAADAVTLILATAATIFPSTLDASIAWRKPDILDRRSVNAFDRVATRLWSPAAGKASDVLLWGSVGGVFVASAAEALVHRHTARKWLVQGVVMAESILVASGLTSIAKVSVRRARPEFYNPEAPASVRATPDASLSFWSGHTAITAAALTSFAVVEWQEEPGTPMAWASAVAAGLVIPTVASLRVVAGKHFPTDVITGGLLGIATGVTVPLLHRWKPAGPSSSLQVSPLVLPGGSGAVAALTW